MSDDYYVLAPRKYDGVPLKHVDPASPKYNAGFFTKGGTLAQAAKLYYRIRALKIVCENMTLGFSVTTQDLHYYKEDGTYVPPPAEAYGSYTVGLDKPIVARTFTEWTNSGDTTNILVQNEKGLLIRNPATGGTACFVGPEQPYPQYSPDKYQRNYSFYRGGDSDGVVHVDGRLGAPDHEPDWSATGGAEYSGEYAKDGDPGATPLGVDWGVYLGWGSTTITGDGPPLKFYKNDDKYYPVGALIVGMVCQPDGDQFPFTLNNPGCRMWITDENLEESDNVVNGTDDNGNSTVTRTIVAKSGTCLVEFTDLDFKVTYNIYTQMIISFSDAATCPASVSGTISKITVSVDDEYDDGDDAFWGYDGKYDTTTGQLT